MHITAQSKWSLLIQTLARFGIEHFKFGVENNDKDPKFKVGDHLIIWKIKNTYQIT